MTQPTVSSGKARRATESCVWLHTSRLICHQHLRPSMGNDSHGDCVFAAGAHAIQTWTLNAGLPAQPGIERTMSDAVVLSYYSRWAGYVPGDPATDNGFVIADFLDLWKADGYGGVLRAIATRRTLSFLPFGWTRTAAQHAALLTPRCGRTAETFCKLLTLCSL